ncbi:hypothetical protein J4E93_005943 [Alternaria ventricosa]|uniref:uncharacterized protein n=1 Tax=Alternaria ventricosa TaxID=1187951 RepID=UPI0020C2A936|nr:uncharacterized protein J4E93_005943 [Alternaria ventricosa]KAI4645143.1 hypothetical protein J4E93_005943 [Alternaria ventricosa]
MSHDDSEVGPQYDPQRTTAAAQYQSYEDLWGWGWRPYYFDSNFSEDYYFDLYKTWGIGWALEALGLNPWATRFQDGENHIVAYQHKIPEDVLPLEDQTYIVNGKEYRATGADFTFSLNTKDGVIIGMDRTSPKEAGKTKVSPPVTGDGLPKLNQFSDVAWLEWQHMMSQNNGDIKNIHYFVSILVVNPETRAVVARALRTRNKRFLEDFPGETFERGTDEMNAIMGTPNIQGFAYMLVQHKAQLGNMYIKKIQVFTCQTAAEPPCIIAHVSKPDVWVDPGGGEVVRRDGGHNVARMHRIFAKL